MRSLARAVLAVVVVALGVVLEAVHRHGDAGEALYQVLPYVPAEWFQYVGAWYTWADTCVARPALRSVGVVGPALECRAPDAASVRELWVIVATNKGGSILGARVSLEMAQACGLCWVIGYRENGNWPPPQETLPSVDGDVMPAIANVQNWPDFVRAHNHTRVRCVVVVRDPLARLMSLYTYALDAGEMGLRPASVELKRFGSDFDGGVEWMWRSFAKESMEETQRHLVKSLARPECKAHMVSFDKMATDFDGQMELWFDAWAIPAAVRPTLLRVAQRHDLGRKTAAQRAADHHVSGSSLTSAQKKLLRRAFLRNKDVMEVMSRQAGELGLPGYASSSS